MKDIITAHKAGPAILFKGNTLYSRNIIKEIFSVLHIGPYLGYFGSNLPYRKIPGLTSKTNKIFIWQIIHKSNEQVFRPMEAIFKKYNCSFEISDSLSNYIIKESRRQTLENTPFPVVEVKTDVSLFDRCAQGAILNCIQDYFIPSSKVKVFSAGYKYLVVESSAEADKVIISTKPFQGDDINVDYNSKASVMEWTSLHPIMENWFDDSVNVDFGQDITQKYPERVTEMKNKLVKLGYTSPLLLEHSVQDAPLEALKRGVLNCKLMRMGKSRESIVIAELWGSKSIAIIATKNIRIFWKKELETVGIKDYVIVNKLRDLDKPAKYYLMTYNWIRTMTDPTEKPRKNRTNLLKKSYYVTRMKYGSQYHNKDIDDYNKCPHCDSILVSPNNPWKYDNSGNPVKFSERRGYMCINTKCSYLKKKETDNKKCKGAAWYSSKPIKHKFGNYVDIYLAKHRNCDEDLIKDRQCPTCHLTDGVWKPPIYRRFSKRFSAIIADEIHNAKDRSTLTAQALYSLKARRRIGLTGTPQSNSVMDIYHPFHWLMGAPKFDIFPYFQKEGFKSFEGNYCRHVSLQKPTGDVDENGKAIIKIIKKRIPYLNNPAQFWKFTAPKVIRRTYSDPLYLDSLIRVGLKLPTSEIHHVISEMHPEQKKLMLNALLDFKHKFKKMVADASKANNQVNEAIVLGQMSALCMIATCPERINNRYKSNLYKGPAGGGKIKDIHRLALKKLSEGEKVLIISDFVDTQRLVEQKLTEFNPIRFDVGWDTDKREDAFNAFANDPERKVFIAGTRAINAGIDLSSANSVICCDVLWSPALQQQAWSRTLAPTKNARNCDIYIISSKNSIDEAKYETFYAKIVAAQQAFDRKVVARKTQTLDIKMFAESVLDAEEILRADIDDFEENETYLPNLELEGLSDWREI